MVLGLKLKIAKAISKNLKRAMKKMPKPLLEANAPWSGALEGPRP